MLKKTTILLMSFIISISLIPAIDLVYVYGEENPNWKAVYDRILTDGYDDTDEFVLDREAVSDNKTVFALAYINSDSIPELVVAPYGAWCVFFTVDDGKDIAKDLYPRLQYSDYRDYGSLGYYEGEGYIHGVVNGELAVEEENWFPLSFDSNNNEYVSFTHRNFYSSYDDSFDEYWKIDRSTSAHGSDADNVIKVDEDSFYSTLNQYINTANYKEFEFFENSQANRALFFNGAGDSTDNEWDYYNEWSFENYSAHPIELTKEDYNSLCLKQSMDQDMLEDIYGNIYEDSGKKITSLPPSYKRRIEEILENAGGGQCYGMAATSMLVRKNELSLNAVSPNLKSLHQAERNDKVESIIGYYHLGQYSQSALGLVREFRLLPLHEQIRQMEKTQTPYILSYGAESWGSHAVVATGVEHGHWTFHKHDYDTRIRTYDPNFPEKTGEKVRECSYFYINSSTFNWEVPNYYYGKTFLFKRPVVSSYGEGYIKRINNDLSILNEMDIVGARSQYGIWLRNNTGSDFTIRYGGFSEVIETDNDESLLEFYDEGVILDEQFVPVLNVQMKETNSISVCPEESEPYSLDLSILYPDCYVKAVSDNYEQLDTGPDGSITVSGSRGNYMLSVTSDNPAGGYWDTVEIEGKDSETIGAMPTDEGILVSGDNLKAVNVKISSESQEELFSFSTDEGNVLISTANDRPEAFIDKNHDGLYEEKISDEKEVTRNHKCLKMLAMILLVAGVAIIGVIGMCLGRHNQ